MLEKRQTPTSINESCFLDLVLNTPQLPSNGNHPPVGLVVVAEVVFLGFAGDDVLEEGGEFGVGAAGAEDGAEVEFEVAAEAGAELAVAGEAELVAVLAEVQVRHRADEADLLAGGGDEMVGGGAVGLEIGQGSKRAGGLLDELLGDADGEEIVLAQDVLGADGHELDEAEECVFFAGEIDEGGEFVLGLAFHEDAVELDGLEAGGDGGVDTFEDAGL